MNRLYQRHKHRKVTNLDGFWQFKTDPGQVGEKEKWYQDFPKDSQLILVPGCWNNELGLYHYEGAAWYRREFETEKSEIILVFHGFYGSIKVYVDGKEVGSHYGGFAGYQCLVDGLAQADTAWWWSPTTPTTTPTRFPSPGWTGFIMGACSAVSN